ncbi:hypothetical protein SAMN02800692_3868 [Luteibacter sp. UNC138MFCol5.1]|uniref:hypothetical protein n=1 Tax=Luteibacter sp. UNC138MFCol5.1 TaxID=1502774 RepID=UPI0008D1D162|nr:hypothetical protein [Luteibacter sp. UNC138MFCol5.1]SEP13346.1 hypothetical protein SAMN02800692_3868 [Luteibacter sp. UNC138MFCol5.1]
MPQFSRQRVSLAAIVAIVAFSGGAAFAATPPQQSPPISFGQPTPVEALGDMTGGSDTTHNTNQLNATMSEADARRNITGTNVISSDALSNASGIPTVIQNSGNNVIIQNATIVNLRMNP